MLGPKSLTKRPCYLVPIACGISLTGWPVPGTAQQNLADKCESLRNEMFAQQKSSLAAMRECQKANAGKKWGAVTRGACASWGPAECDRLAAACSEQYAANRRRWTECLAGGSPDQRKARAAEIRDRIVRIETAGAATKLADEQRSIASKRLQELVSAERRTLSALKEYEATKNRAPIVRADIVASKLRNLEEARRTEQTAGVAYQAADANYQNAAFEARRQQRAAGVGDVPLEKPPFTATPAGQPLDPDAPISNNIATVRTASNRLYGAPGNTRDLGTRAHHGIDEDNGGGPSRFTGKFAGRVIEAVPHSYLGGYVLVEFRTPTGQLWQQKTMHMTEIRVSKGDLIEPGTVIGEGQGAGTIFAAPHAGPPHVHTELLRDGRPVNPANGAELPFNAAAELRKARAELARLDRPH